MAGTGRKVWVADEVLAAADLQNYIQDQVVFVYASAAARNAAILAPTEGMISYLGDTKTLTMYNGTAWVDVLPNVGTAGTYTKVTTDSKGRVSSGTTLSAGDIPTIDINSQTSGTLAAARLADLDSSKITTGSFASSRISGTFDGSVINGGSIANITNVTTSNTGQVTTGILNIKNSGGTNTAQIAGSTGAASFGATVVNGTLNVTSAAAVAGSLYGVSVYNQNNTGRAVYVASDGLLGVGSSSKRFKENIVDAGLDVDAIRKIAVKHFTYKKSFSDDQSVQLGVIAEDLVELGLSEFVFFGDDGKPDGVAYDRLALAALALLQVESARLDELTARIVKLESK